MFSLLSSGNRDLPILKNERLLLRPPVTSDHGEWAALRRSSRAFLEPWEPQWLPDELERPAWRERLKRYRSEFSHGTGVSFLIFDRAGGAMMGGVSIGNIRRGVAQNGQIGYWMGERHAGKGHMSAALELVTEFGFERLKLHRIEAACIPENLRSVRVLEKAGFQREGLLRSYLRINGVWQDHYLYALIEKERRDKNGMRG
ncbi:MAG: GNAT family N-acetyltransferase [Rhizobiaceae bacterium]|nr:GNAT family N-acetyltransferase [Rhizobiaceae bacterium]MCV0405659.1 GNAT family N-acetyltransferase [Rhizobiaceae bacterium]